MRRERVLTPVPIVHEDLQPERSVAVWRGGDSIEDLRNNLPARWQTRLPKHPARVRETLSARSALLHLLPAAADSEVVKDDCGKPHLAGHTQQFSLTHSHGYGGALVADSACGVDLQLRVEKILRLRSKFEREDERDFVSAHDDEVAALHVLWGAKDSLFKLWGRRVIDWHEHLIVDAFDARTDTGVFSGRVCKNGETIEAQLDFGWVGDFCLVSAFAKT